MRGGVGARSIALVVGLVAAAGSAACYGVLGLGDYTFDADASTKDGAADGEAGCVDPDKNCWACTPQTTEQFLNSCGPGGCIPFDDKRLEGLLEADGGLPPLPALDGGTE